MATTGQQTDDFSAFKPAVIDLFARGRSLQAAAA